MGNLAGVQLYPHANTPVARKTAREPLHAT
jgi:hypothetical protein